MIFQKPLILLTAGVVLVFSCGCAYFPNPCAHVLNPAVILPSHAGSWYKREPKELQEQLSDLLNRAKMVPNRKHTNAITTSNPPVSTPVLALICPHAAYPASGLAAAYAYKLVSGKQIERVFILAPCHRARFHGALLPAAETFSTPIGNLHVDQNIVSRLLKYPQFHRNNRAYRVEHSLEMQLPFIRKVLGNTKIVPILIGRIDNESEIRALGKTISGCISRSDLVVASSDFTHYGAKYKYLPFIDHAQSNIKKLDSQAFYFIKRLDVKGFLEFKAKTRDTICGYLPCAILMSMLPKDTRCTLLDYYTCQDSEHTLDKYGYSVSYMAIAFTGNN